MNNELLPCVELDPPGPVRWSVVWMHGLGANGHDFEPVVPMFELDPAWGVRFVFPHAPPIPVTLNGGFVMPAWYDIIDADLDQRVDQDGLRASADRVRDLMAREVANGVPEERILLAGFSQGGAVALHVALRYPKRLAGLIALSTYLPDGNAVETEISDAARTLPVFSGHGTQDPMVPHAAGVQVREQLEALGLPVTGRDYHMAHEVNLDEIRDLAGWMRDIVGG